LQASHEKKSGLLKYKISPPEAEQAQQTMDRYNKRIINEKKKKLKFGLSRAPVKQFKLIMHKIAPKLCELNYQEQFRNRNMFLKVGLSRTIVKLQSKVYLCCLVSNKT
jgi:hypothetical protein